MPDAVYVQTLNEVKAVVQALDQTGLRTDDVEVLRLNWKDIFTRGGVTIRFEDMPKEIPGSGTNERDQYSYPCHVIVCKSHEMSMAIDFKAIQTLRQLLIRKFHHQRIMSAVVDTGTDEQTSTVTDGPTPPAEFSNMDVDVYSWTVWTHFLEPRDV